MRTFKLYISLVTAFSIAFPATLFAGTNNNNMELLKQSYKEVGVGSNKNRQKFQANYLKMRPNLPPQVQAWMDQSAAQWGNHQMPEIESQVVKGKKGQDILKLIFKDSSSPNHVVVEVDPEADTIKINGQTLPEKAMYSGEEFMKFVNENSKDGPDTSLLDQSLIPSYDLYKAMRPGDRALYFSQLRLVLEAAQKVMEEKGEATTADKDVRSLFEMLWSQVLGVPAEAAPSDAKSVMATAQVRACNAMKQSGQIKATFVGGSINCNATGPALAALFAQQPTAYRTQLNTAIAAVASERATEAACRDARWSDCNGVKAELYLRSTNQLGKVATQRTAIINSVTPLTQSLDRQVQTEVSRVSAATAARAASDQRRAQEKSAGDAQTKLEKDTKAVCDEQGGGTFCRSYVGARNFINDKPERQQALQARLNPPAAPAPAAPVRRAAAPAGIPQGSAAAAAAADVASGRQEGVSGRTAASDRSGAAAPAGRTASAAPAADERTGTTGAKSCIVAGYIGNFGSNGSCTKAPYPQNLQIANERLLGNFDKDCNGGAIACNPLLYGMTSGKAFCVGASNKSTATCESVSPLVDGDKKVNALRILASLLESKNEKIDAIIKDGKVIDKAKFDALKSGIVGDMDKYIDEALKRCGSSNDANCAMLKSRKANMAAAMNELESGLAGGPSDVPPPRPGIVAARPVTDGECTGPGGVALTKEGCPGAVISPVREQEPAVVQTPPPLPTKVTPPVDPVIPEAKKKSFPWKWILGIGALVGVGGFLLHKFKKNKDKKKKQEQQETNPDGTIEPPPVIGLPVDPDTAQ
ncbi:MAG: hypothetical protein V4736_04410 [Bdellovibrionota bacterium]